LCHNHTWFERQALRRRGVACPLYIYWCRPPWAFVQYPRAGLAPCFDAESETLCEERGCGGPRRPARRRGTLAHHGARRALELGRAVPGCAACSGAPLASAPALTCARSRVGDPPWLRPEATFDVSVRTPAADLLLQLVRAGDEGPPQPGASPQVRGASLGASLGAPRAGALHPRCNPPGAGCKQLCVGRGRV
jgi:hypothetical protein